MNILSRHRFAACLGFLAGPILTYLGLFAGLQVASAAGTLLAFPIVLLSVLTGEPIGAFSGIALTFALLFSCVYWSCVFVLVAWLWSALR